MKYLLPLALLLVLVADASAQKWTQFEYKTGDLLFQDLDCGGLCDAIETVTPGHKGRKFSHVGLVYVNRDSVWVIEAIGKGVQLTRLDHFMLRSTKGRNKPKVVVGRMDASYSRLHGRALGFALQQIGKDYDKEFIYGNGRYYCSELIYDAYKSANDGEPIFRLPPMTFKDPANNNYFPAWEEYYKELNVEIPEGKPGCNPGSLANEPSVQIVKSFY